MCHQTELDKKQTAFLFQEESFDVYPYLHTLPRKELAEPEMQLMLVILEDALRCLEKYVLARNEKGKMLFHETEDWVFSKNEDWIFSFSNVCEVLGFNPQYARKAVLQWKTRKLAPPKNNYHEQI
jgi:hypothetical protein